MTTKNIFEIGASSLVSGTKSSKTIYKKEIFADCKTDKEKKHLRLKLRRHLQKFIASYVTYRQQKANDKLEQLKKDWLLYAKNVYENTEIIIDGNASDDLQKDCKIFLDWIGTKAQK